MNRLRVSFLVIATILTAGFLIYLCLPKEPRYQGRSLSQWLRQGTDGSLSLYLLNVPKIQENQTTRDAVQTIGTNAVPFLAKWGSAKNSGKKAAIISWLNAHLPRRFHIVSAEEHQWLAYSGFGLLEEQAKPAWPLMAQWTLDKDVRRRTFGFHCLVITKADKAIMVPVLERMLSEDDKLRRESVAIIFCQLYPNEAEADGVYRRFPNLRLRYLSTPNL